MNNTSSLILVTLMKEALGSSETSVLTRATRCNIPEDTILHPILDQPTALKDTLCSTAVSQLGWFHSVTMKLQNLQ
jgi:hypothetical protein